MQTQVPRRRLTRITLVNIQFGSNFMGKDDIHELTGEPYLATTLYGPRFFPKLLQPPLVPGRGKRTLRDRIFMEKVGRGYRPRKGPATPYRTYLKLWRWLEPKGCKYGIHLAKADITEVDASIWRAECMKCKKVVRARKPVGPNLERAREMMEFNDRALEEHLAIEAYHEGRGPCPFCTPPEGEEHAKTCWEVADPEDLLEQLPAQRVRR